MMRDDFSHYALTRRAFWEVNFIFFSLCFSNSVQCSVETNREKALVTFKMGNRFESFPTTYIICLLTKKFFNKKFCDVGH